MKFRVFLSGVWAATSLVLAFGCFVGGGLWNVIGVMAVASAITAGIILKEELKAL